jgi:3-oxoacyl-[acyl-carrier protein] reductase
MSIVVKGEYKKPDAGRRRISRRSAQRKLEVRTMTRRLGGQVVIVTGARGIGEGIAHTFAREGAKVVVATRTLKHGEEVADAIRRNGNEALALECDIAVRQDVFNMVEAAVGRYGKIDLLVNNAAVFPNRLIGEMSEEDARFVIDANVLGPMWLVQACLPFLRKATKSNGGRIVLVSSLAGTRMGVPGYSAYGASKAAVNGLSKSLAVELAPDGITCNVVEPGTTMSHSMGLNFPTEELRQGAAAMIPLGKMIQPEEIAHACLFFCLPENKMITGQELSVDGGSTAVGGPATPPPTDEIFEGRAGD